MTVRPFDGVRVLDLTHVLAGPFCTYQLALLGADIIKIEPPHEPDAVRGRGPDDTLNAAGMGINFQVQGSNKRAMALDLKTDAGRDVFRALVAKADVLVENYRAGALASLGLGADEIRALNPRLVYCSITGFGQIGERAGVNAYDNVIQAASGLMQRTGTRETGPLKAGASVVDYATGQTAAFAIAAALFQRSRTGLGQTIDCAMLDTALLLMAPELSAALYKGPHTARPAEAGLGTYRTADGQLTLGAFNPRQNGRLWRLLGRADFAAIDDWPGLWASADSMRTALAEIMPTRRSAQWEADLHAIGVPTETVRSLSEAAAMPHLAERNFLHALEPASPGDPSVTVPLAGFRYREDGPRVDRPPPRFGEHTDAILAEEGYSQEAVARLRRDGVVA